MRQRTVGVCPPCNGSGLGTAGRPCPECNGSGGSAFGPPEDCQGILKAMQALEFKSASDGMLTSTKEHAKLIASEGTHRERADAFAAYVRSYIGGDADDIAYAIATLCVAVAIERRFVRERVGEHAHHWTVWVEAKLENGEWYRP